MRLKWGTLFWTAGLIFTIYIVAMFIYGGKGDVGDTPVLAPVRTDIPVRGEEGPGFYVEVSSRGGPVTHIAFIKVHKTASSTAQNVFMRFGDSRNLSFILPHTKGESGWPNVISYNHTITDSNIVPVPKGHHFDIMCCHVLYNRDSFRKVLPKDTVYIGIVREPISRVQSAIKYFSPRYILSLPGPHPLSTYVKDPLKFEPKHPADSQLNNRMAVEFGFPLSLFPGQKQSGSDIEIKKYLKNIDNEFKFIIVSEMFDESMVYMKRILRWETKDILYMNQNPGMKNPNPKKILQEEEKKLIKPFLKLDFAIYDFSVDRFQKQIANEGDDFKKEVEYFKDLISKVTNFCQSRTNSITINKSKWNKQFNVTKRDCNLFKIHEKDLLQKQRLRMYGTINN